MTQYKRSSDRVIGKVVLHGIIKNTSPMLIASGASDNTDKDCIRWVDGKAYIPSSSITGAIQAWYKILYPNQYANEEYFWGTSDTSLKPSFQSHFVIDECLMKGEEKAIFGSRDGVEIEHTTGIAKDKGKYDYELLERDHTFSFRLEATCRSSFPISGDDIINEVDNIIDRIIRILRFDLFAVGAHTTTGFGKLKVDGLKKRCYDFKKTAEARNAWFDYVIDESIDHPDPIDTSSVDFDYCKIDGHLLIKSALLTSAYPTDVNSPDKVQLKSKGSNVLSGKAIKGALRHRAAKILRTLGHANTTGVIANMFGEVDDSKKRAIKSRLIVHETIIDQGVKDMIQDRIKIDRWTGGVIGGAKFDSQPIWNVAKGDDEAFCISMLLVKPTSEEIALLLHLMRDLWTGDLPIGGEKNVGRGVLQGVSLDVYTQDDQSLKITKTGNEQIIISDPLNKLNQWNNADLTNLKTR